MMEDKDLKTIFLDQERMKLALKEAKRAGDAGEVPIGAVAFHHGKIIGTGYNRPIADHDPSAHAEIIALRAAGKALGNYRMPGLELYVTLEPCTMCVGAIVNARCTRVIYGASDSRADCTSGIVNLSAMHFSVQKLIFLGGILQEDSSRLLHDFFSLRRNTYHSSSDFKK